MQAVLCAICGINAATTSDHVPPRSLYPPPRDGNINLHTVPACRACNNGSSVDDETFKVLIGLETGEHQHDPQKIIQSLARTIGHNARIANQVFSTSRRVLSNLNGSVLEPSVAVTFDFKPYERVITRIVRGLHWRETGTAIAAEHSIRVLPGNALAPHIARELMELMHLLPLKKLNKDTFAYRFHIEDDGQQIWGMQFFERHTAFALLNTPAPH